MTKFNKRVARVEQWLKPKRQPRVFFRFEGPGSEGLRERFPEPTAEEIAEGWPVLTIRSVAAKDGRPATPEEIARRDASDGLKVVDNREESRRSG